MNLDHTPHPLVEDHYHIRELIEAQEKRSADRQQYRDREKLRDERNSDVRDAKAMELKPFWCDKCQEDFFAQSIKEVEVDWSCPTQYIAFYRTKHWCHTWCMRLITDRHRDAYWFRSKEVARDKGKHYQDLLQPHQTGFNTLYKKI